MAAALKPAEANNPWEFDPLTYRQEGTMDKIEARKTLLSFVYRMRNGGTPQDIVDSNFFECLGMESDKESKAFDLVGEAYPHMVVWVYTFQRRY